METPTQDHLSYAEGGGTSQGSQGTRQRQRREPVVLTAVGRDIRLTVGVYGRSLSLVL